MGKTDIIVGGQYGSEGKGVVAALIAQDYDCHIRVGGPNAGHSFVHDGKQYKMQAVPCGWVNPTARLCLGPGAVISVAQLEKEIKMIPESHHVRNRLFIDPRATIIMPHHDEGHTDGEAHKRIGSTGEGIGAARMDRFARDPNTGFKTAYEYSKQAPQMADVNFPVWLGQTRYQHKNAKRALIEGTQGYGLSITHGEWPFVTTSDPTAGSIAAECGIGPKDLNNIIAVFRSRPIRVAGNSGPLRFETTWEAISKELGRDVEERTTVTKKVRRIGGWDWELFDRSVEANTPTALVLTFADYLDKGDHNVTQWEYLSDTTKNHVKMMERISGVPVILVGTGYHPETGWVFVDRRK